MRITVIFAIVGLFVLAMPADAATFKSKCKRGDPIQDCDLEDETRISSGTCEAENRSAANGSDACKDLCDEFASGLILGDSLFCEAIPTANASEEGGSDSGATEAGSTSADGTAGGGQTVTLKNPLGEGVTIPQIIGNIIQTALGLVGSLALLMFVYGGFLWLTSGGSPDRVKKGKDVMVWAAIGLVLVFGSVALVRFVIGAFSK